MKDRFNRDITYLRLSITDNCNYNCLYCKPDTIPKSAKIEDMTDEEILQVIKAASNMGVTKIRLTGGEPLVRSGVVKLISDIKQIDGISEIVMTTNASLLQRNLKELKEAGLERVNISLDSLDPIQFKYITKGGDIKDVLSSIDQLLDLDMKPVKVNVVLIKGFNDHEIKQFVELTKDKEIIVRFIELMPIGSHDFQFETHFMSNKEVLMRMPDLVAVDTDPSETAKYFKLPDSKGKVGLISSVSQHFCASCNRIRITSDGKVKTCLHGNEEFDILKYMREEKGSLTDYLKNCIMQKPQSHHINERDFKKVTRSMYQIGG